MDVENFMSSMILVVQVGFENSSYLAAEDAGPVSVCVNITGQLVRDIVVTLSTADGSAIGKSLYGQSIDCIATLPAPGDYISLMQELTFNQGVRRACEDITIVPDSINEVVVEMFSVTLNSDDSAVVLSQSTATVSIGTYVTWNAQQHNMTSVVM